MSLKSLLSFNDKKTSDTMKVTLVTAIFTIIAAVGSVTLQNYFTVKVGQDESLRVQRRETYLIYENAYNSYYYKTSDFKVCLTEQANKKQIDVNNTQDNAILAAIGMRECSGAQYIKARYDYQDSLNKIHLDGSSSAIKLAKGLSGQVPASIGTSTDEYGLPPLDEVFKFQLRKDDSLYSLFLDQACMDIRPTDKSVCEEFSTGNE